MRSLARHILADLAIRLDEFVHVAVLEGDNVRYVSSGEGPQQLRIADRTGQVLPALTSAMGRAMLAELRPDHLAQMRQRLAAQDVDVAALEAQPAQICEFGYALNARSDDITSPAMIVQDPRGTTIAAINAAGPSIRTAQQGQKQIARQLHAAAAQIEEALRAAPNH